MNELERVLIAVKFSSKNIEKNITFSVQFFFEKNILIYTCQKVFSLRGVTKYPGNIRKAKVRPPHNVEALRFAVQCFYWFSKNTPVGF